MTDQHRSHAAVDWQESDRSYCCAFIATADPGSVCAEITDGHRCGRIIGHDGACECDCGRVSDAVGAKRTAVRAAIYRMRDRGEL